MTKRRGIVFIGLPAFFYGFSPLLYKIAQSDGTKMYQTLGISFLIAIVVLSSFMIILKKWKRLRQLRLKQIIILSFCCSLLYTITISTMFNSMNYVSPSLSELSYYTYPIWISIIFLLIDRKILPCHKVICLVGLLFGIYLIQNIGNAAFKPVGVVLALISSLSSSLCMLFAKNREIRNQDGLVVSFYVMCIQMLIFPCCMVLFQGPLVMRSVLSIASIIAFELASMVLGFFFYFQGAQSLDPSEIAIISSIEPMVAVIRDAIILNNRFSTKNIIGIPIVLLSLCVFVCDLSRPEINRKKITKYLFPSKKLLHRDIFHPPDILYG